MRLIDADALIDFLRRLARFLKCEEFHKPKTKLIGDIINYIEKKLHTIEAEPVKHGRWVYDHWCEFKCSVCGEWSKSEPYRGKENYCPSCGAKMYVTDISHKEESE